MVQPSVRRQPVGGCLVPLWPQVMQAAAQGAPHRTASNAAPLPTVERVG